MDRFKHNSMDATELDVIIIGGGPAGLSTALWCAELGLTARIIDIRTEFGGQLLRIFGRITNYLGFDAQSGRHLRDRFVEHLAAIEFERSLGSGVTGVDLGSKRISLIDGSVYQARTLVIATGVRRRKLNIAGEDTFQGRGILRSGVDEQNLVIGKRVVIVGGGDAALENAALLAPVAERVFIVHRREGFFARPQFVEAIAQFDNVECVFSSIVTEINGSEKVESVTLLGSESVEIMADSVLIRIGVQPNSDLFRGQVDLDRIGYLVVDRDCKTSVSGVFAVGDVANPISPTISTAVGMGATAAKSIFKMIRTDQQGDL
ncbi:MAG: FAD-dependent oxidoreductase [Pyrinomonadaceae bacterium]